jgi:hypothetical protein
VEILNKIEGIKKVEVTAGASRGKFSIMEVRLRGEENKYLGTKCISCDELKDKGVIKRSNSFNKAEEWLNTEEGIEWVSTAKHHQIF